MGVHGHLECVCCVCTHIAHAIDKYEELGVVHGGDGVLHVLAAAVGGEGLGAPLPVREELGLGQRGGRHLADVVKRGGGVGEEVGDLVGAAVLAPQPD